MSRIRIEDLPLATIVDEFEQDQAFGAGLRRRRPKEFRSAAAEVLEAKQMLSGTAALALKGGVLTVKGTNFDDRIYVSEQRGLIRVTINGRPIKITNAGLTAKASAVKRIDVFGGSGNDTIDARTVRRPTILRGGDGFDHLNGGLSNDRLEGGGGGDLLSGGAGNDVLLGGFGNDILRGGAGDDRLSGDEGRDRLFGEDGNDVLLGERQDLALDGGSGENELRIANSAPTLIRLSAFQLAENVRGAKIARVAVSDADPTDTHTFTIDDARFEIVDGVLKLKDNVAIDFEKESVVSIFITATDSGKASVTRGFEIRVLDQNELPVLGDLNDLEILRDSAETLVNLDVSDPEGNALEVLASSDSDQVVATVVDNVLKLTPAAGFSGVAMIKVLVTDKSTGKSVFKEFQLTVRGTRAELVDGVLMIRGSAGNDDIRLNAEGDPKTGNLVIKDGNVVVGTFRADQVRAIQVEAGDGDDTIDLTAAVMGAWVYGGTGKDTILGGSGDDHLFGMGGADTIFGNAGSDVIYGGDEQFDKEGKLVGRVDGGAGTDFLSLGTGRKLAPSSYDNDVDIEAMNFEDRSYFDLLHQFRDAYGFVVSLSANAVDEKGDAMIFTGLAATLAAQRGDAAVVLELLRTLRDQPFVTELGRLRLIRHPQVWDYVEENGVYVRERHSPVTKDGIVGVISALHYAFNAKDTTAEVRDLAKEVAGKYIDYLIANNWMTIDRYPDHYWETRTLPVDENDPDGEKKEYFSHVFGEGGSRVQKKGIEGYALGPNDRYALKNVAAQMGFATQTWSVWGGVGVTLGKALGDATADFVSGVADNLGNWASERVDAFLKSIKFDESFAFHVVPGLDWTLVKGDVKLEIPSDQRAIIANLVGDAIRSTVKTLLGTTVDEATEAAALGQQLIDLQGRLVDRILDSLPSWLQGDKWRPLIGDAIQQTLPWLSGDILGEVIAFTVSHRMSESDVIVAHLSFWPTLVALETRPELVDILMPSIRNLDGKLNPGDTTGLEDPDASKMDMALYAWLAGRDKLVTEYLQLFETDRRFDALAYAWKKEHKKNVEKILAGDASGTTDSGNHRLEYLLLKSLQRQGTPISLSAIRNDWVAHWREQLKAIGDQAAKAWQDLKSNLVDFAKALAKEFGAGIDKIGPALWSISQDVKGVAAALWSVDPNLGKVASTLWGLKKDLGQVASALWNVRQDVVQVFLAMRDGAKVSFVDSIQAVVDAKLVAGDATSVGKFLILQAKVGVGTAMLQLTTWLKGDVAGAFWGAVNGAQLGWKDALDGLMSSGLVKNSSYEMAKFLLNTAKASLTTTATAISQWLDGNASAAFWAIYSGAGKTLKDAVNAVVWAGFVKNSSYEVAKFLLNTAKASLTTTATAISQWLDGNASAAFWAIYSGAGKTLKDAVNAVVWAGFVKNSSYEVAKFLLNTAKASLTTTATAISQWLDGNASAAFWAIYSGAGKSLKDAVNAVVWAGFVKNSSYEVAKFLLNTAKASLTTTATAISQWLDGNASAAFWAIYSGAGRTLKDAVNAVVWAGFVKNGSYEVAKFLLNTAKASLTTTATAISQWLDGNASAAFWAIYSGAGRTLKDAVNAVVWAGFVKNGSYEVAKFLLDTAGASYTTTANAVSEWLGGNRDAAFWAIATGAGKGYVNATKALIWAKMIGDSYTSVFNYLKSQLSYSTALSVVNSIF